MLPACKSISTPQRCSQELLVTGILSMHAFNRHSKLLFVPAIAVVSMMGCANFTKRDKEDHSSSWSMSSLLLSKNLESNPQKAVPWNPAQANNSMSESERVANPPARTIRFDGHEAILGNGIASNFTAADLRTRLKPLVEKDRTRSET